MEFAGEHQREHPNSETLECDGLTSLSLSDAGERVELDRNFRNPKLRRAAALQGAQPFTVCHDQHGEQHALFDDVNVAIPVDVTTYFQVWSR